MDNDELELGHYGGIFRRNWWLITLSVVACVLLAVFFLPAQRDFFESKVSVLLRPGEADFGRDNDPISEETEIGIARSSLIGDQVVSEYGAPLTLDDWRGNLLVSACLDTQGILRSTDCNSQILEFSYRGETADEAARIVQLSADAYLNFRINREELLSSSQIDDLSEQLGDLDLRLENELIINTQAAADSAEKTLSDFRLRQLESERIDVRGQLSALEGVPIDVGESLGGASTPRSDSSGIPRPISAFAGLLIGLLLGALAALLSDRLDRRLTSAAEAEQDLGVPVLGDIPRITEDSPTLVTAVSSQTPGAEAFRRLAAAALASRNGYVVDSITVTGANEREGRTTTAVNLALALSQSGRAVLLVAGDRRNTAVDRLFGLVNQPGLNDFLRGRADLEAARSLLAESEERLGIRVVPTGGGSPPPLSSSALSSLLAAAREENMMVVFDSPPALLHADGLQLSSIADAVYILAAVGRTRRSEMAQLRVQLLNVQADVAGAILNRSSRLSLLPAGAGDLGPASIQVPTGVPGNGRSSSRRLERNDTRARLHQVPRTASAPAQASPMPEDAEFVEDLVENLHEEAEVLHEA